MFRLSSIMLTHQFVCYLPHLLQMMPSAIKAVLILVAIVPAIVALNLRARGIEEVQQAAGQLEEVSLMIANRWSGHCATCPEAPSSLLT